MLVVMSRRSGIHCFPQRGLRVGPGPIQNLRRQLKLSEDTVCSFVETPIEGDGCDQNLYCVRSWLEVTCKRAGAQRPT